MTAQRWYAVEAHRHGKGQWARRGAKFPARILATGWAESQGWVPVEDAVNGSGQVVYRLVCLAADGQDENRH